MANYNLGSVTGEIRLDYDGRGTKEAQADIKATAAQLERETLQLKLGLDEKELRSGITAARAELERLSALEVTPEVQLEIGKAQANIIRMDAELAALGNKRIKLQVDIDNERAVASFGSSVSKMFAGARKDVANFGADVRNTSSAVEGVGTLLSSLAKPVFFASLASGAGSAVAAVVPLLGTIGLLPAVAFVAAGAFAAVKIGTAGMGDAFKAVASGDAKALAEAMAKLSPNAQEVVRSYQQLKPALDDLKLGVQDSLFQNLGATISAVATQYVPILGTGLGNIALGLNDVALGLASTLQQAETADDLGVVFENTSQFISNASSALGNFLGFLLRVAAIASGFLPQMGTSVAGIAEQLRDWSVSAEGTAKLSGWIANGVAAFTDLYYILVNVGQIIVGIFKPLTADGQGALGVVRELAAATANWVQSAEGQQTIAAVWQLLSVVGGQLVTILKTVGPILGSLVTWFAQLPAPVQAVIGSFIGWATVIGLLLAKFAPVIGFLIQLGPLFAKLPALITAVSGAFTTVMGIFSRLITLFAANPWILLIAAVIALAYIIYSNWDAISAYLQGVWARITAFFSTTGESLKTIGTAIWSVISAAWTAAINGIVSFFSGVWAGITSLWATITAAFVSVGTPVWNTISAAWNAAISGIVTFLSGYWTIISTAFMALVNTVIAIGSAVWETIKTLWYAAILTIYALLTGQFDLIGQIWSTLISKLLAIGSGLWATISGIWSGALATIIGVISGWVSSVVAAISSLISRVVAFFTQLGSSIIASVSNWASQAIARVTAFAASIVASVAAFAASIPARISAMVASVISFFSNMATQGPSRVSQMVSSIISYAGNLASSFVSAISGMAGRAVAAIGTMAGQMLSALASLPGRMASLGASIISGIISGISGAAGRLFSYLGGLATQALNSAKAAFGINSPSKLFRDNIGNSIPEGIQVGIIQSARLATGAAADLAGSTADAAKKAVTVKLGSVSDAMWSQLLSMGYKGDPTDGMEALYVPQDVLNKLSGLTDSQQSQVAALTNVVSSTPASAAMSAAAMSPSSVQTGTRTITIENLTVDVTGIVDPTDPVSWRRFGEDVRDLIKDVEDSYK